MDGLIFDIKKYSVNDGPGIRTTVFFKGCPLRCWWCHNPESQANHLETINTTRKLDEKGYHQKKTVGSFMKIEEVMAEIMKDSVFYEESGGGVTFSGGEPGMQPEFLFSLASECKKRNIHTVMDTCGNAPSSFFSEILPMIDLFLYDLKLLDNELHYKYTGASNHIIIENLKLLSLHLADIIIRIPVIPGITDTEKNIQEIAALLSHLPSRVKEVHLLPFHKIAANKYKRLDKPNLLEEIKDMKKEDIIYLKDYFEEKDFKVKIGG